MQKIIELLIPIVGMVIGLFWGEFSKYLSDEYQKRQIINKTISILLELYFQIKRISFTISQSETIVKCYSNQFSSSPLGEDEKDRLRDVLFNIINPFITEITSSKIDKINSDYNAILKELSCYYPVDAYRLRGRNEIQSILNNIDAYYMGIMNMMHVSADENAKVKSIIQIHAVDNCLSVINEEIKTLSNKVSRHQRKEIIATLNNIDKDNEPSEKNFEDIKQRIMEALNENIP